MPGSQALPAALVEPQGDGRATGVNDQTNPRVGDPEPAQPAALAGNALDTGRFQRALFASA